MDTKRFILRPISIDDREDIYNILKKEEVIQNLNMEKPSSVEDIDILIKKYMKELEARTYEPIAIIEKNTNNFIGVFLLKLDLYNEDAYEYTTYIDTIYWNKGIITEVLEYMTTYFFNNYKQNNFRGYVMEKNKASARILEKCNFKLEKIFKVDGLEGNILSYLMTREDFDKMRRK